MVFTLQSEEVGHASQFVIKSCDILLLSQQFLHALIAINPYEGRGW